MLDSKCWEVINPQSSFFLSVIDAETSIMISRSASQCQLYAQTSLSDLFKNFFCSTKIFNRVRWKTYLWLIKLQTKHLTTFFYLVITDTSWNGQTIGISLKAGLMAHTAHRFERITRYNLSLTSVGNSLETVGSYTYRDLQEFFL
jgi:hypothetical protein